MSGSRSQNFDVKILRQKFFIISLLINYMMDLVPIWYQDRYWSKVFISTISTRDHDLEVEVTALEF